jgi:hypothetical protein
VEQAAAGGEDKVGGKREMYQATASHFSGIVSSFGRIKK